MILRQKTGEQHAVPVLVSKFLRKLVDLLATVGMAPITSLFPPGLKLLAKRSISQGKVAKGFGGIDGPPLERGTRGGFGQIASLDDHAFQSSTKIRGKRGHCGGHRSETAEQDSLSRHAGRSH